MNIYGVDWSKGEENLTEDDYNLIISEASKVISENTAEKRDIAIAYSFRGNAYQHMGKLQEAISDYTLAIELLPDNRSAYYNRGGAYFDLKNYSEALYNFSKALEIDPTDRSALNWVNQLTEYLKTI